MRVELLEKEKELTRLHDALATERRALPWLRLETEYRFSSEQGQIALSEAFGGCSQLLVYHFMFGPDWEEGCKSCSFVADHFNGTLPHLKARDTAFACISRAPIERLLAFRKRMGWKFPWYSSENSSFNFDFGASFESSDCSCANDEYNYSQRQIPMEDLQGFSVFAKGEDGRVYHTYACYARGVEVAMTTYGLLDLLPNGRDEQELESTMEWVRYNDSYKD